MVRIVSDPRAEVIDVILVTFERGDAESATDPLRQVVAYRKLNGELIVEMDPIAPGPIVGVSPRYEVPKLTPGDERMLTLRVRATVVDSDDGHGLCYELALENRSFSSGRTVSVDADEVVDVGVVPR